MNLLPHNKAILDASFLGRLSRIDTSCDLIDFVGNYLAGGCVLDNRQFRQSPCNEAQHECQYIEDLMSDEEIVEFYVSHAQDLDRVYSQERSRGDFHDVKIMALASTLGNCIVLSCDGALLWTCWHFSIDHLCFKAAVIKMCVFDEHICGEQEYSLEQMRTETEDPFFGFSVDRYCSICHGQNSCGFHPDSFKRFWADK